jgi:hypothetical protein
MPNLCFSRSVTALFTGAAVSCALALSAGTGCGGSAETATAGAMSASVAGSDAAGGAQGGAGNNRGGSSGASSGGRSNLGGTSSGAGGTSNSAGATSGNAGSSSGGDTCATLTTQAACTARSDCYVITKVLECPGSGAACPTAFARCSDNGCDPACSAGSVCVTQGVEGGALILESDAGTCPAGTHPASMGQSSVCERDPSYSCKPIPAACGSKVACPCVGSLCDGSCQSTTSAQVTCIELVP